jgi:hypothetical protein
MGMGVCYREIALFWGSGLRRPLPLTHRRTFSEVDRFPFGDFVFVGIKKPPSIPLSYISLQLLKNSAITTTSRNQAWPNK